LVPVQRRAIWNGFFASALLTTIATIVVKLPPSPDWPYQREFEIVPGFLPRIIIASLIALVRRVCELDCRGEDEDFDEGKYLWARTISFDGCRGS